MQIHDDHFPQDATDIEWLREIGQRGWIVLTKDTRIRYRSHEQTALMQAPHIAPEPALSRKGGAVVRRNRLGRLLSYYYREVA